MLFLLAAILASRVFLWRQLFQKFPNLQIVIWRKNDIKKSGITRFRAYFEIPKSLKVPWEGSFWYSWLEAHLNCLETCWIVSQKNWRGVDIHNWPANTNERYFIRFLIASLPLKYSYHPIEMSISNRFILRFNALFKWLRDPKVWYSVCNKWRFYRSYVQRKKWSFSLFRPLFSR